LQNLYLSVVAKIQQAIQWYDARKRSHKRWGLFLRATAVTLAGLASVTPIVIAMMPVRPDWNPVQWIPLASLLAALGAGCIGLDKLLGHSASWMRYLTALLELESQLEALQFAWSRRALEAQSLHLSKDENLTASLNLLQESLAKVTQLVKSETLEWVSHFSGNLMELEKTVVAQRTALASLPMPTSGALKVEVSNVEALDGRLYELQLGDTVPGKYTDPTKAFTGLSSGLFKLRVSALRGGHPVSAEEVISIRPGETTVVKLTLP
jgi:hypothetical protein